MRYYEIFTEAPISDITTHGFDSPTGSFSNTEKKLITHNILNKVYVEKLKRIPFNLYVYVLNKEGLDTFLSHKFLYGGDLPMGVVHWDRLELETDRKSTYNMPALQELYKTVHNNMKKDSSAVQLILGNNWSDSDRIMLTPWMLVHRLLHTVDYDLFQPVFLFGIKNNKIVSYHTDKKISWWDVAMMKSASIEGFENDSELFLEFGVEYLITGNIRINATKIEQKCNLIGLNYQKIMKEIQANLETFKKHMDKIVISMQGTTRYT